MQALLILITGTPSGVPDIMAHYNMPHLPKLRTEDRLSTYSTLAEMGSIIIKVLTKEFFHDDISNDLGSSTSGMGKT